jgi:predicted small lipoprotein YifL
MKKLLIIPALAVIALAGCGSASSSSVPPGNEAKPVATPDAGTTSQIVWTQGTAKMYEVLIPNGKDTAMRCYVTIANVNAVSQTCTEIASR